MTQDDNFFKKYYEKKTISEKFNYILNCNLSFQKINKMHFSDESEILISSNIVKVDNSSVILDLVRLLDERNNTASFKSVASFNNKLFIVGYAPFCKSCAARRDYNKTENFNFTKLGFICCNCGTIIKL